MDMKITKSGGSHRERPRFVRSCMLLMRFVVAPFGAVSDAVRAAAIAPQFFGRGIYRVARDGNFLMVSRKPFTTAERWRTKLRSAKQVFERSLRIRIAPAVCIPQLGTEGLLANLLHVLEILHRVRPDTVVVVNWILTGEERGFRYGRIGDDVWAGLFRPIAGKTPSPCTTVDEVDLAFWGTGKDYLRARALQRHRNAYHRTFARWIEVTNARVHEQVHRIYERFLRGRFSVGCHRRVGNAMVSNIQGDGAVHPLERFIECVSARLSMASGTDCVVFLATDDKDAIPKFEQAFGDRLVVREDVQRTIASEPNVNFFGWGKLSLEDAEDVLIDALLLARCDVLVHGASSISTLASLVNPSLQLVRVTAG